MKILIIVFMIACTKGNFIYDRKYKNDIEYYFNNLDKLNKNNISYVIEKAAGGDIKALFLYIYLFYKYPFNTQLKSRIDLMENTTNLIKYLQNHNEFKSLGYLYEKGIRGRLEPNISRAIECYNKAIDAGYSVAAYKLGLLYQYGIEGKLEANIDKAIEYYNKAIDMDYSVASYRLGKLYHYGIKGLLEFNINKAIKYYIKAIDMGYSVAAYRLGFLYQYGIEDYMELNTTRAIEYYIKAIDMGYSYAIDNFNDLCNKSIREKLNINEAIEHAFNLYDKYKYKHNIILEAFKLEYNDEEYNEDECKNTIEMYENNIKECYGTILGQKIASDSNSTISSFKYSPINNDLFISYDYICSYLESLLNIIPYFDRHNFVIDCIKLINKSKFDNDKNSYVNIINIKSDEYISLGVESHKKLLKIINRKRQLLDHINKVMSGIDNNSDLSNSLNEIMNIESQLCDILIYTSSLRNIKFINKYKALFNNN